MGIRLMIQGTDGAAKPARGQVQRGNTLPITPRRTVSVLLIPADAHYGAPEPNGVCDANDWGGELGCRMRDTGVRAGAGRYRASGQGQRYRRHYCLFGGPAGGCPPDRGRSLCALRQGGEVPRRRAAVRRLPFLCLPLGTVRCRTTAAANALLDPAHPLSRASRIPRQTGIRTVARR